MLQILGKTGKVDAFTSDGNGNLKVQVGDEIWVLNPQCCTKTSNDSDGDDDDDDDDNDKSDDDEGSNSKDSIRVFIVNFYAYASINDGAILSSSAYPLYSCILVWTSITSIACSVSCSFQSLVHISGCCH